ncbi:MULTISPECIES: GNAT family N-acetyltransferase [unclassified Chelatococcus]|uniref:GNAT family N-acetyltransferase n=2 Tax=Chelatococcus TaxID=28209 RepID=UPI001BCB3320|nr:MULTISPECIES: GNAT family N-acetyltransferase [unclassified Chelatococcus]MBS7738562.1 GNAT family N-acetyltransferase [Chelatococcus sp. HY11]MCO5076907.1 GNAT family N-acetyltransferase [Chelatococcus sp.]CAH1672226.1 hypothetical protein CHELA41_23649 [Hyphomicrobiales bacterium]CAH1675545.1 hypothetical protein CHELA20_51365 [Hyphomicrobiales bacterium]
MPVIWGSQAPVRRVDVREFARLEEALAADASAWLLPRSQDADARAWNHRIRTIRGMTGLFNGSAYFACTLGPHVAGVAIINSRHAEYLYLELLLTHPGQQGAGSLLIEHIVNDWARPVTEVRLATLVRARDFYLRLGFLPLQENQMRLDLRGSPQWEQAGGRWRLKAYAHLANFATWSDETSPLPPKAPPP